MELPRRGTVDQGRSRDAPMIANDRVLFSVLYSKRHIFARRAINLGTADRGLVNVLENENGSKIVFIFDTSCHS